MSELSKTAVDKVYQCESGTPIFLSYKNNTGKTIEFIKITFSAKLPKRSSNILDWSASVESDLIVEAGKTAASCVNLPIKDKYKSNNDIRNAVYHGEVTSVSFQE